MGTIGKLTLQADESGMITLQCSRCDTRFEMECSYLNDDYEGEIFCPCCGISGEMNSFYPKEAIEEAQKIAMAEAEQMIADMFKGFNSKVLKVQTSKPHKVDTDITIKNRDYNMMNSDVLCCNRKVGLSSLDLTSGFYCPYCGRIVK